jgi:tRNA threonylcarbamoyladenosine biosynthesis protein TsaB
MNLLALETSTAFLSIALKKGNQVFQFEEKSGLQTTQGVLPVIQDLLNAADLTLQDLQGLALGIGPGRFTGLRIATSVIQGIAFAHDLLVMPISSLQACAQHFFDQTGAPKILTAFNAYQEEIYWGAYQLNSEGFMQAIVQDCLIKPDQASLPNLEDWVGVGDAFELYPFILPNIERKTNCFPTAKAVLRLAEAKDFQKEGLSAERVIPVYLRGKGAWKMAS